MVLSGLIMDLFIKNMQLFTSLKTLIDSDADSDGTYSLQRIQWWAMM